MANIAVDVRDGFERNIEQTLAPGALVTDFARPVRVSQRRLQGTDLVCIFALPIDTLQLKQGFSGRIDRQPATSTVLEKNRIGDTIDQGVEAQQIFSIIATFLP